MAVTDISDDIRTALNLPKEVQAAVIADIDAESPAAKAGLREGDIIQEVNKQSVRSAKDLLAISKKLKAEAATSRWMQSSGADNPVCAQEALKNCGQTEIISR